MITQTFWKCVQAVKDDIKWATHLQSPSCLPCFVSSCCSSLCTAATAASPSWSTRRAARSTRQSGPAPQLPRCPPREPEQPSAQNTAATNSSCLRLTNYRTRGLNSCQIYWDGYMRLYNIRKDVDNLLFLYLCFPPLLSHVIFGLEPCPLKFHISFVLRRG